MRNPVSQFPFGAAFTMLVVTTIFIILVEPVVASPFAGTTTLVLIVITSATLLYAMVKEIQYLASRSRRQ